MAKLIDHIDHIAYVSHPETLESNAKELSRLSGVQLEGPYDAVRYGVRVMMAWESGLEIVAPIEGADAPFAQHLREWLGTRGEGLFSVIFGVRDIEEARNRAESRGYAPGERMRKGDLPGMPWETKLVTMIECAISDFMGTSFLYGEIAYSEGVVTVEQ